MLTSVAHLSFVFPFSFFPSLFLLPFFQEAMFFMLHYEFLREKVKKSFFLASLVTKYVKLATDGRVTEIYLKV